MDPATGDVVTVVPRHYHELAHAAAWHLPGWPPMFLREGLAVYLEHVLAGTAYPGRPSLLPPNVMGSSKSFMRSRYSDSPGRFVHYLVEEYGLGPVLAFYSEATCQDYEHCCEKQFGRKWSAVLAGYNRRQLER